MKRYRFQKIFFEIVFLISALGISAQPQHDSHQANFRLPPLARQPQINGRVECGEWDGAGISFGGLITGSHLLEPRHVIFYLSYDSTHVYFACRSELPPDNMKLLARTSQRNGKVYLDDAVELLLLPPHQHSVYQLIANSKDTLFESSYSIVNGGVTPSFRKPWNSDVKIKSGFADGYWTVEMAIPLRNLGIKPGEEYGEWRVQMCRDWRQPAVQSCWSKAQIFCDPATMGVINFDPASPVIQFTGLGQNFVGGDIDCVLKIINNTKATKTLKININIDSGAAPAVFDEIKTIAPGNTENIRLRVNDKAAISRDALIQVVDTSNNTICFSRRFAWEGKRTPAWNDGESRKMEFDFAYYPYLNRIKTRVDISSQKDLNTQNPPEFFVRTKNGGTLCGSRVKGRIKGQYLKAEWILPDLPEDDYEVVFDPIPGSGINPQIREFKVQHFPWEHNRIGMDEVIVPPFRPLEVVDNGRTVKALLTEYTTKNGFWNRICSQGENILADSIGLVFDGSPVKFEERSFQRLEADFGKVATETIAENDEFELKAIHEYDYDGMCKLTWTLIPKKTVKIGHGYLEIPLKTSIATLFHSVNNNMKHNPAGYIPSGSGTVWDSRAGRQNPDVHGNFRPYFWFGGIYKGLCWFTESDLEWNVDPLKPALELCRDGGRTTLRIHIFSKDLTLDRQRTFVMGFQATPVKTQPTNWQRLALWKVSNPNDVPFLSGLLSILYFGGKDVGALWPAGHDYTIARGLAKTQRFTSDDRTKTFQTFSDKHFSTESPQRRARLEEHLRRSRAYPAYADYVAPYLNARGMTLACPEYQIYMDEWWCSEYRANAADEYNYHASSSYQDMFLYYASKLVSHGIEGLYLDNVRDWHVFNTATGPAYEREDGSIQPYYDIFKFRELIKRTAVMLYMSGSSFFDGRPILWTHMTNTNLIPFMGFASISLDWEHHYGSTDFQTRFSDGYILSQTLGTQTGCIPSVLIKITGNNLARLSRTFIATILAYDLPLQINAGGFQIGIWHRIHSAILKFGYGLPDTEIFPCWQPQHLIAVQDEDIKIALYKRTDKAMLILSDFKGTKRTVDIDLTGLDLGDRPVVYNIETGQTIPVMSGKISITLDAHDFSVLQIEKNNNNTRM